MTISEESIKEMGRGIELMARSRASFELCMMIEFMDTIKDRPLQEQLDLIRAELNKRANEL